jgi:hypothetical protein
MFNFKVEKNGFIVHIQKTIDNNKNDGIVFKTNEGTYVIMKNKDKKEIFLLENNKWKSISKNIISFLQAFNRYEYDEIYFLEALIVDLFPEIQKKDLEKFWYWLPGYPEVKNKYYIFQNHKLIAKENGLEYEYDMPTNLGITHEQFQNPPKKELPSLSPLNLPPLPNLNLPPLSKIFFKK